MQEVEGSQRLRCIQKEHSGPSRNYVILSETSEIMTWKLLYFWLSVLMYKLRPFIKIYTISLNG